MNTTKIMQALAKPFPASDVEWRLQYCNNDKTSGFAVPYIDSRAIQRRLDETVGAFNWKNCFVPWKNDSQLCGISIYFEDRGEWITKYDGADNSDIEPVKGGLSDASKRAAVQWGIGRFLYQMEGVWVDIEQKGKSVVIKQNQYKKLNAAYDKMVAQLAKGTPPSEQTTEQDTPSPAQTSRQPSSRPSGNTAPNRPQSGNTAPSRPPIGDAHEVLPFPELYTVTSAKKNDNGSGVSTTLDLTDPQGNPLRAYLRGEDPAIKSGVKIKDLKLVEKMSGFGTYYILNGYEIAA